ncbi:MAG: tripartite tricarboxylate transporter substrate binding protein [Comamonadaceae bacterium]|nr:MAG: tripartite tricarboxylate transporter substrate binding protein [Comamonadaceae bacterium]
MARPEGVPSMRRSPRTPPGDTMHDSPYTRRRLLTHAAAGGLALGLGSKAFGQSDWPNQPIKFIVPFAAGGVTDLTMRTVSKQVADKLGQAVVIDNRAGAGGTVGMTVVAKAAPNGYTIGATASSTIIATPLLNSQVPFDPAVDFAFVSLLATVPMVLTVPSHLPIHTAADFLKYVADHKGKLSYGSTAVGHYGHVAMMEVSDSQGAGMVHSPYKGEAPLLQDVLGGQLQCAFFAPSTAKPNVDGGKLRLLGVSGTQRLKSMPNVPTLLEQGWTAPVFRMNPGWVGVLAPAKTPAPILQRLSAEYMAAIRTPEINDKISEYGMAPVGGTPEEFLATYKAERPVWKELLTKAGLEVKGA